MRFRKNNCNFLPAYLASYRLTTEEDAADVFFGDQKVVVMILVILSIGSQWGDRPTYSDFLAGVFFFFVCLGLFIGIPVGMGLPYPAGDSAAFS